MAELNWTISLSPWRSTTAPVAAPAPAPMAPPTSAPLPPPASAPMPAPTSAPPPAPMAAPFPVLVAHPPPARSRSRSVFLDSRWPIEFRRSGAIFDGAAGIHCRIGSGSGSRRNRRSHATPGVRQNIERFLDKDLATLVQEGPGLARERPAAHEDDLRGPFGRLTSQGRVDVQARELVHH